MVRPAEQLQGLTIGSGWSVGSIVPRQAGDTGGCFSVGYSCTHPDNRQGFLKALDFSTALASPDPISALQIMTAEYDFEREVLQLCQSLSRIVVALEFGTHNLGDPARAEIVPYIVFELADGNIRSQSVRAKLSTPVQSMRLFHQVAAGTRQLHSREIAHQDLKPSNVLMFGDGQAKLGDLGRSILRGRQTAHDNGFPGDRRYAPPECMYGFTPTEFAVRRFSSDLFLLGSIGAFILTGAPFAALLAAEIPSSLHPATWQGSYADVLPHIRMAHDKALRRLEDALRIQLPAFDGAGYRESLMDIFRWLLDPDPSLRGHPRTRAMNSSSGNPFELERILSALDVLCFKVAIAERRAAA